MRENLSEFQLFQAIWAILFNHVQYSYHKESATEIMRMYKQPNMQSYLL